MFCFDQKTAREIARRRNARPTFDEAMREEIQYFRRTGKGALLEELYRNMVAKYGQGHAKVRRLRELIDE